MSVFINGGGVGSRHATYLGTLAAEIERPIVLVAGSGRSRPFDPQNTVDWQRFLAPTGRQVRDSGLDYSEIVENGIMLFNWAGKHAQFIDSQLDPFPGFLWSDGEARRSDMRDFMCDWRPERMGRQNNRQQHDPARYTTTQPVYLYNGDEPTDYLIGEVAERVVWFHYPVEYILEQRRFQPEVWYQYAIKRSIDEDFAAALAERVTSASRDAFIAYMGEGRMSGRVVRVRRNIAEQETNVNSYRSQIARSLTSLTEHQRELDALMQVINQGDTSWDTYWQQLVEHPRIAAIEWQEPTLVFRTDEVQLRHPVSDDTTPLGIMEIKIDLQDQYITIHNLTNARGNRAHPHVNGTGPCFGEYEHAVYQMLGDGDLTGLMELMFVYLETFNPRDDWGRYGAYWFRSDGTPITTEQTDEAVAAVADGRII